MLGHHRWRQASAILLIYHCILIFAHPLLLAPPIFNSTSSEQNSTSASTISNETSSSSAISASASASSESQDVTTCPISRRGNGMSSCMMDPDYSANPYGRVKPNAWFTAINSGIVQNELRAPEEYREKVRVESILTEMTSGSLFGGPAEVQKWTITSLVPSDYDFPVEYHGIRLSREGPKRIWRRDDDVPGLLGIESVQLKAIPMIALLQSRLDPTQAHRLAKKSVPRDIWSNGWEKVTVRRTNSKMDGALNSSPNGATFVIQYGRSGMAFVHFESDGNVARQPEWRWMMQLQRQSS